MNDFLMSYLPSTWVADLMTKPFYSWPACESLHFVGLCLLIGCVGTLDLRMLGVAKGLPLGVVHRFVKWGILGFAINLVTGLLFFTSKPGLYLSNVAFAWKMGLIGVGGLNALTFYASGLGRRIAVLGPGEDAPLGAKIIAATSLIVWFSVMTLGRLLPYLA